MTNPRTVLIEKAVLARIEEIAATSRFRHEVGGILLGSYRDRHLHILDATGPQSADRWSRTRFSRSPKGHQSYAQEAWRRSDGLITHIGEWHSHPEPYPVPSVIDRASWVKARQDQQRALAFIIVGMAGRGVWLTAELGGIVGLSQVDQDDDGLLFSSRLGS